jgi:hypothetical protein
MKIKIIKSLIILTLISACSNNSPVSNQSKNSVNKVDKVDKNTEYITKLKSSIITTYYKEHNSGALNKINMKNYLSTINDSVFINSGLLSCKILNNITPEEDKFNPATMPGIAKDVTHPLVYVKVKDWTLDKKKCSRVIFAKCKTNVTFLSQMIFI